MSKYSYSVIIPYRDKYELLLKAVDSVLDRDDIQIIIIDNSIEPLPIERVPVKKRARVDFLTSSPTKGGGCARNVGLNQAMGSFLLFLDADDYYTPNAFEVFDKYLDKDYDIVYFKSDSISLIDGGKSHRHEFINSLIDSYFRNGDEGLLRYKFVNPISKMIRSDFVVQKGILFDEIRVSNDVWFSVMSGHEAKHITADNTVVYMITSGEVGSSLTLTRTKDNWFIRYQVMVRVNQFLKSIGKYRYRIRLFGALRVALKDYGFKEFIHLLKYAHKNRVGVF